VPSFHRAFAVFLGALAVAACTPSIGDKCVQSTDCSQNGDRLCDTSQPDGYCTVFNCIGAGCPDDSACVLFNAGIPGCGFDDRSGPNGSRVGRSFCVQHCFAQSDCRGGYICADPRSPPWNALVLDGRQTALTCLVAPPGYGVAGGYDASIPVTNAPVCSPVGPDAGTIPLTPHTPADASASAPPEGGVDAGSDAGDAGDGG